MEWVILNGLKGNEIPVVGQIIRVADEYDAIVSKRQYKSHIGISDTLKIIIENSNPVSTLGDIVQNAKVGKNNKTVVKALLKVVRDDTEFEIACIYDYMEHIQKEIKRLKEVDAYHDKMLKQKKEKDKEAYLETIKFMLVGQETPENYKSILQDWEKAYERQQRRVDDLYKEIKEIKKLRV